ncbi:MAG: SAM-dependent DNA methyltransferase [Clostridia bacterium]|nr:SAM-dependent DNA methyltransferase [Clostridia bacterium]
MATINIRKLETELWEAADLLRADSKVTSQEYCMPVLGLIFLRYAYSRFKYVEAEILKDRPVRNGRVLPVEADDFKTKSAIFLPEEARYDYLLNLPDNTDMGQAINHAMELIETQSGQLKGILPKNYTILQNDLLHELLRIFNNSAFNEMKDDIIGRIYEYFLNKFAPAVASDDGVFFTPKSLVRMIVNIIEPTHGTVLDPACGSGGMFVSSADFIEQYGANANTAMTFFGQEKVDYNAKLCIMNMAVHGLNAKIVSGDEANSFYHDAHNMEGSCDYVMANPPFNVDKVKSETAQNAGRLPFGLPGVNAKTKEIGNANYLWISYFHAYLKETGRAGFVMASSATDSQGKDKDIREKLIGTGDVDVMISVGNNFFYTKSLPCTLWFFDRAKREKNKDKVLFIDARNYYTVVDRTLNEWSEWQMKNLNAIVWLYRGETEKYTALVNEYKQALGGAASFADTLAQLQKALSDLQKQAKLDVENAARNDKKRVQAQYDEMIAAKNAEITIAKEAIWLTEKFGDGEYRDVLGLCKLADRAEIAEKGYSLTPGAYVGVAPVEDDGVDFAARMAEIHSELLTLQAESSELMDTISKNMKEMGL